MHTKWYYRDPNAPEPNRGRVLSVMALIERDGLLLVERRSDAPVWSLIAGFVEDSESLTDALRREVAEETSPDVSGGWNAVRLGPPKTQYSNREVRLSRLVAFLRRVGGP